MVVRVRVGYSSSSTAAEGVEEGGRRKRRQCTRGEGRRVERDSVLDPPGDRCVRLPERRAETPASFLFSLRCFSLSLSPLYRFPYKRAQFRVPAHYSSLFFSASSSFELSLQSPTSEFSRSLTHSSCFCQCHRRSFRFEPLDVGGAAATHTPSTALHNACKHPPALNLRLRSFFPSSLFFLLSTSFVFVDDVLYYCVRVFNTFLSVYLRPLLPPPPLRYRRRRPTAASSPFLYNLPPTLFAPPPPSPPRAPSTSLSARRSEFPCGSVAARFHASAASAPATTACGSGSPSLYPRSCSSRLQPSPASNSQQTLSFTEQERARISQKLFLPFSET